MSTNPVEFKYTCIPRTDNNGKVTKIIERPYIPIKIVSTVSHKRSQFFIDSLLDTGADNNLFPASFAEQIGIKVTKGKQTVIRGIGNSQIHAYIHYVDIIVGNNIRFSTEIHFCNEQNTPLLGRHGFFDRFKQVIFDQEKSSVILFQK